MGVVLVVLLVAGLVSSVWTVHRSFPKTSGSMTVDGLDNEVTVVRDDYGIPQIYADTSDDLFFAQGYVQAQDRFFEMDFRRHVTAGRLSELVGEDALETDMLVRTMGWRRVAEQELPLVSLDTRRYLESFAGGVNAYLADHDGASLSLEYAALGLGGVDYHPESWTAVDSLAWLKAMAWDLGSNLDDELARSLESVDLTHEQIAQLYPDYPYDTNQPIVTQGAIVDGVFEQDAQEGGTRLPERPAFLSRGREALLAARRSSHGLSELLGSTSDSLGSNAWAVSGDHTASGAPILANDPHLGASMPSVWYQMGLHCTEVTTDCPFDVSGFTFAGLPGVVIGHNASIAWGLTNLYPDVQDLYLEKVVDADHYRYDGKVRPMTTREERFEVEGGEQTTITVRATRHGPLISDVSDDYSTVGADAPVVEKKTPPRGNGYAVALRWTALEPGETADAVFALDRAATWDEFRDAARSFDVPAQNLVYADVEGHIGYQAPGRIPIRRTGNGDWPVPGWDPAYEWDDSFIPFESLPSVLDPEDGYVVTANQAVVRRSYPYYIGSSYDHGYRAQRIRELLSSRDGLTISDMAAIQLDDVSALAQRLTPYLRAISVPGGYYRTGQNVLSGWDHEMAAASAAAAYFNVVWKNLLADTFHDELPADTWPEGGARWWAVIDEMLDDPEDPFWDDVDTAGVTETRDDVLRSALMQARDELTRIMSRDPHRWEWGRLHTLTLRNATLGADSSPARFLFNRGPYEIGGGPAVVDAAAWDATEGYEATAVPSMRMIIPLDDLNGARWINLAGASGHAYNGHYTDQTDLWVDGQTLPWAFTRDAVGEAAEDTLTLVPLNPGS